MQKLLLLFIAIGFLTAACGDNPAGNQSATDAGLAPTESSFEKEGILSLISPEDGSLPMGDAEIVMEAIDPTTQQPIAPENLQINLWMEMEGAEPMTTMTQVEADARAGRYKVKTNLGMAGMWKMDVESTDPAIPGKATFDLNVK